jgi:disulfide oxidoreductase YuzD
MDPVTTAIIAAIAAGAGAGANGVAAKSIVDGYQALKALIKRKFGESSEVVKAVDGLENKPDSAGRKQTVSEELTAVKAADDIDVLN